MFRLMFRPVRDSLPIRPAEGRRRGRRICLGALTMAGVLYLASPYVMLWSMGSALRLHDDTALRTALDWESVRAGLKQSLGLIQPVQQVSDRDELPGFGDSFASGVASGMIDQDITPQRLDTMLDVPALRGHGARHLPRGFFTGPARFRMEIPLPGMAPVGITMRIEKWRWKITRVDVPEQLLAPAPTTRIAASS